MSAQFLSFRRLVKLTGTLLLVTQFLACGNSSRPLVLGSTGSQPPLSTPAAGPVTPQGPITSVVPYEVIKLEKINLPGIVSASFPTFTNDGQHLLFAGSTDGHAAHIYTVSEDGSGLTCLSCGVANEPAMTAVGGAVASALPDGKRAIISPYSTFAILECAPSLLDCQSSQILPIDVSAARPSVTGVVDIGGGSAPHLAPDGVHLAFSDVRSDAAELMVMGTLVRHSSSYVLTDPRVINPAGPSGATDMNPTGWSNGGQLYEFKSFADGGASATYVAFPTSGNPDVIKVNLATGATTRLTSHPDWDEDDAPSPDGTSIVVESDRGMHRTDMFGLMPVRPFIDTPLIAALAIYYVGSAQRRECDLQPWLLPESGDINGTLMGQPLLPYSGGDFHGANNISGLPQWSPDGTKIALSQESFTTTLPPPYLLIAHLTSRLPTTPVPTVSSQPGSWAVSPAVFHGSIQSNQPVVVNGLASGNAVVTYAGVGVLGGTDSVTYNAYSDDGVNFVSGTEAITNTIVGTAAAGGTITWSSNLKLSGAHTGSRQGNLAFVINSGAGNASSAGSSVTGTVTSTFDKGTVTGPPVVPMPCPDALPKLQTLGFTQANSASQLTINVTSSIASAGQDELRNDVRPVWGATVTLSGVAINTDRAGNATFPITPSTNGATFTISAGDTMIPIEGVVAIH